jgi:hypothetical protein
MGYIRRVKMISSLSNSPINMPEHTRTCGKQAGVAVLATMAIHFFMELQMELDGKLTTLHCCNYKKFLNQSFNLGIIYPVECKIGNIYTRIRWK